MDTIYGLATVVGKSGVAVLRISGARCADVLTGLNIVQPVPRLAKLAKLYHPQTQELLDEALVLYFQAPHSFTGEDVVELHVHGSIAVINDIIAALQSLPYLRLAEAGEFSKRAFYAGKLDLTAAEGLAALIDAETSMQKKLALRQYSGELANLYESWRGQIVNCLAQLEALIDFPDEDIPTALIEQINITVQQIAFAITQHLQKGNKGEILMRGIYVVIVGRPNVGKSSFLNYLTNRDAAIVSELAGTTRDVLELRLDIGGFPITIKDTAGIRATEDVIEAEGIRRAKMAMHDADIVLLITDATNGEHAYDEVLIQEALTTNAALLVLYNKIDLPVASVVPTSLAGQVVWPISIRNNTGLAEVLEYLAQLLATTYTPAAEPVLTKARYREALQQCLHCLQLFGQAPTIETACEEIRLAASSLGVITGRVQVEELLDIIFSSFCIGK